MTNRPALATQVEVTRYAKAMRAAAVDDWRLIIHPDGRHEIIAGKSAVNDTATGWEDLD